VKRLGRAHEDVIAAVLGVEPEVGEHLLQLSDDVIDVLFRRAPGLRRGALDVRPVLVRPRQEVGLEAALPLVTRQEVGDDGRVQVPHVGQAVGVIDGGRDVECFHKK
jgi:hypothetical protein